MMVPEPALEFLGRVDAVEERLDRVSGAPPPRGLTAPDEPSGERWEWGQVWAHLAEFPAYWVGQLRAVFSAPPDDAPSFGRVKSDSRRVDAIETDRRTPAPELWDRIRPQLEDVRTALREMTPEDWERQVTHPTLGVIGMRRVFEVLLVGHLEEHAGQLEGLLATPG